jgi:hypothetical protein
MGRNTFLILWGYASVVALGAGACSGEDSASEAPGSAGSGVWFGMDAGANRSAADNAGPNAIVATGGRSGTKSSTGVTEADIADLPVEQTFSVSFELPQVGKNYVFITNPSSNNAAVIDANTLGIRTVETGANPKFLQTVAGTDTAIALNVDSSTATVIRAGESALTTSHLEVIPGANAIAVTPDGKHAVVYVNSQYTPSGKSSGSYQKITVLTLNESGDSKVDMTVAYKPANVFFSKDSAKGYVVAEQYVSILDFADIDRQGGASMRSDVSLGYAFGEIPSDVSVTPDGHYALARLENASVLHLVDLSGKDAVKSLNLAEVLSAKIAAEDAGTSSVASAVVTDLDMSSDGAFAIAVVREKTTIMRIPIPQAFGEPSAVDAIKLKGSAIIGSAFLAPDNRHVLLYTTVTATGVVASYLNHVTVLDLQQGIASQKTIPLYRGVKAVAVTSDSSDALIVHKPQPNAAVAVEGQTFEGPYAYSLLKLGTGTTTMQTTWADIGPFAFVPEGKSIFILFRDDKRQIKQVHRVSLDTFVADTIGLESPPNSVGSIPTANKVFIGQEHSDGWITFIDLGTNQTQSVTGFELNSRIRE